MSKQDDDLMSIKAKDEAEHRAVAEQIWEMYHHISLHLTKKLVAEESPDLYHDVMRIVAEVLRQSGDNATERVMKGCQLLYSFDQQRFDGVQSAETSDAVKRSVMHHVIAANVVRAMLLRVFDHMLALMGDEAAPTLRYPFHEELLPAVAELLAKAPPITHPEIADALKRQLRANGVEAN